MTTSETQLVAHDAINEIGSHLLRVSSLMLLLMLVACAGIGQDRTRIVVPTNEALIADFLGVTYAGPSKLLGTKQRSAIYKVADNRACLLTLGEQSELFLSWIEDARQLYSLPGYLSLEREACGAKNNIIVVLIPRDVNSRGADAASSYSVDQVKGALGYTPPSLFIQHYQSFVRQRYYHLSDDAGWYRKLCIMGPSFERAGVVNTVITISVDYGYPRRCIYEEILQSLGLAFDTVKAWPSIIRINYDGTRVDSLDYPTTYDLLNLRVLYDPDIKAGMTAKEVEPIAARIIRSLRTDEQLPPDISILGLNRAALRN